MNQLKRVLDWLDLLWQQPIFASSFGLPKFMSGKQDFSIRNYNPFL
jgi:hypothetical protein